ncbi:hypothetical protein AAFF_G00406180 [Aldrovandia affinis]|uniref:Uncharacterized protein n=1 Tax=Aldrovandia affinis TaxID=143900 RepID=A0AAD7SCM5_9TELE|nr:hypothetical protein AAFF_G00406180 [Aldrovandia affinis]
MKPVGYAVMSDAGVDTSVKRRFTQMASLVAGQGMMNQAERSPGWRGGSGLGSRMENGGVCPRVKRFVALRRMEAHDEERLSVSPVRVGRTPEGSALQLCTGGRAAQRQVCCSGPLVGPSLRSALESDHRAAGAKDRGGTRRDSLSSSPRRQGNLERLPSPRRPELRSPGQTRPSLSSRPAQMED